MSFLLANNGAKSTNSLITEIGSSNPASLHDFSNKSAGLSYHYDSKIDEAWIAEFGRSRIFNFIPQSIGMVIPKNNFRFGIAINQAYNNEIDYGKLEGTMIWNNDRGYIDTGVLEPKRREVVFKNSFIASYGLNNLVKENDKLIFGLQLNYNYLKFEQNFSNIDKLSKNVDTFNFAPGLIYEFDNTYQLNSQIGMYYESKIIFNKKYNNYGSPYRLFGEIPDIIHLGFSIKSKSITYAGNISYLFWENLDKNYMNVKNQIDLSASVRYMLDENLEISFGFYSTDRKYEENYGQYDFSNLNATFLIISANYKIDKISFDFTIADSHLISDEWRQQTILKLGTGYTF
jgi:hypothetical protein